MATLKKHIEPTADLIRRYLAGELDDQTMHALERQALEDPFLAEALEGYGKRPHAQEPALNDLRARLQQRVTQPAAAPTGTVRRIDRRWLVAAGLLLLVTISAVLLIRQPATKDIAQELPAPATVQDSAAQPSAPAAQPQPAAAQPSPPAVSNQPTPAAADNAGNAASDAQQPPAPPAQPAAAAAKQADERAFDRNATAQPELTRKKAARASNTNQQQDAIVYGSAPAAPAAAPPPPLGTDQSGLVHYNKAKIAANDTIYIGRRTAAMPQRNLEAQDIASKNQGVVAGVESKYATAHESRDLRLISGKVLDASTGELMRGAIVHERSSNKRVITDSAGQFTLAVNAGARTSIDVSYIGYKPTVVSVPMDRSSLDIYIPAQDDALSEVIVTGGKGRATPQPTLGHAAYQHYLQAMPPVPVEGLAQPLSGEVRVVFTVNPDSTFQHIRAEKPFHPAAGAAAVKRVEEGPKWAPVKGRSRKAEIRVPVKLIPMK